MTKTKYKPKDWSKGGKVNAPKALIAQVKVFQAAFGLKIDGIPGVQTVSQLLMVWHAQSSPADIKVRIGVAFAAGMIFAGTIAVMAATGGA